MSHFNAKMYEIQKWAYFYRKGRRRRRARLGSHTPMFEILKNILASMDTSQRNLLLLLLLLLFFFFFFFFFVIVVVVA